MPKPFHISERAVRVLDEFFKIDMMKIKLQAVYARLNQNRQIRLLQYILKTQGAEMKRLDFSAAAKELDITRAQIARDIQTLERAGLIEIACGELKLSPDIVVSEV